MPETFEDALQPIYEQAFRFCLGLSRNRDDAEDLFQDALLKAMQAWESLRERKAMKSWLYRIISNTVTDFYRRHSRLVLVAGDEDRPDPSGSESERSDLSLDLRKALDELSDRERECLLLYEVSGLSVSEIAEVQGARSPSAIKSRLARARERLRSSQYLTGHQWQSAQESRAGDGQRAGAS